MSQDAPRRGRISPLMGLLLAGAAVALLVPLVLFVQGLARGDRGLITTAGVWWGVTLGLLLALPTSAEQALRNATGRGALVTTLLRFLEVVLAALLPACLLLALLPSTTSRSTLALLALAGFVVVAWGAWSFRRRFIGLVGSLVFAGLVAQIVFPDTSARLIERFERWDSQPHVEDISLEDIERGRVAFFADGEPVLWYHLRADGTYEWFDRPGLHPVYNVPLHPATPEVVAAFEQWLREGGNKVPGRALMDVPAGGRTARVLVPSGGPLALRSEPSVRRGSRLARMPDGAVVQVQSCPGAPEQLDGLTGRWCRVTYGGATGWAFGGYLASGE